MNEAKAVGPSQGWSLWIVIISAAFTFAIMSYLDDWVSLPLREFSSIIAGALLDLIGYPITRHGTIIATNNFSFEVVPACSGSTALTCLLTLGVTWCGSHPGLTPIRRLVAIAAAIPLAVTLNGLRVATLVAIGDSLLHPVEGVAHDAIGVLTFLLALAALFLLGESLTVGRGSIATQSNCMRYRLLVVIILTAVLAAPSLLWCGTAWFASPLDHFGWIFLLLGGAGVAWRWYHVSAPGFSLWGGFFLLSSIGGLLAGSLIDVFLIQAISVLGIILAIAFWTGGWQRAAAILPFLAAASISLPVVGFALTTHSGLEGPLMSLILRGVLFSALFLMGVLAIRWIRDGHGQSSTNIPMAMIALLATGVATESILVTSREVAHPLKIEISWLQGNWIGAPGKIDEAAISLFGREHVQTRMYTHEQEMVNLIITTTGGDRHRAHPPEYCLTGGGWQVDDQRQETRLVGGTSVAMSHMTLHKGEANISMAYWFTDGRDSVSTYSDMLAIDTRRRLTGRRTDWAVVRVFGPAESVDRFLIEFRPRLRAEDQATK